LEEPVGVIGDTDHAGEGMILPSPLPLNNRTTASAEARVDRVNCPGEDAAVVKTRQLREEFHRKLLAARPEIVPGAVQVTDRN